MYGLEIDQEKTLLLLGVALVITGQYVQVPSVRPEFSHVFLMFLQNLSSEYYISNGHTAITKGIQKYLISEKKCEKKCGPKNGSDLESKKNVIEMWSPKWI